MLFFINEIKCSNSVFIFIMVIMTSPIDENLCSSALTAINNDDFQIQVIFGMDYLHRHFYKILLINTKIKLIISDLTQAQK